MPGATLTDHESVAAFEDDPASPRAARHFVASVLRRWELGHLISSAVLLVSELATNVVLHAHTSFEVTVLRVPEDATRLRVEVVDGSSTLPRPRRPRIDALDGRGLLIVERSSVAWGADRRPGGKVVWFELSLGLEHPQPA
jgi:anti-sigma regulatory factor (Ser/Thr protein kinase)